MQAGKKEPRGERERDGERDGEEGGAAWAQ